jgi:L-asparagine oxygenase
MGIALYRSYEASMPLGPIPPTPLSNGDVDSLRLREPLAILVDRTLRYGKLVGYKQEQDGRLIQHIFPKKANEAQQISGSSKAELALHTESAFHPYKPDYVVLMCLRGDPTAATTYANIEDIMGRLDEATIKELSLRQFITRIDDSFRTKGEPDEEIVLPIFEHDTDGWRMTYDEAFMVGTTEKATIALERLRTAIEETVREVTLVAGDILVIDNKTTVHGRRPFQPRYDGTDRWLIRALVRKEFPPAEYCQQSVITYEFGG